MNAWIWLLIAIVSEVIATSSLKATKDSRGLGLHRGDGRLRRLLLVCLTDLGHHPAWRGLRGLVRCGHCRLAVVTVVVYDQKLDAAALVGMGLIIAGVVVLRLFSETSLE